MPVPPQTHQAKFVTWQFDGEYRGDDCTATLTLGNPDILGESGERGVPPRVPPGAQRDGRSVLSPQSSWWPISCRASPPAWCWAGRWFITGGRGRKEPS